MELHLTGKRVAVTGGTRGVGRAIVEEFLNEGARVAFCARDTEEVAATETTLQTFGDVQGTVVDVGDDAGMAAWVPSVAEAFGGLDIVVANASALAIPDTPENWSTSLNVDLMGTVRLVAAAMPYLERSESPAIVAISSVTGREADVVSGPYGAAKTAIVGYIQGLAPQLAGKGIRANTVSPGNTFFTDGIWDNIRKNDADLYDSALALNPTGRMGTPQEMAAAVVFLSSPRSSFTSGTNFVVDGALTRGIQL